MITPIHNKCQYTNGGGNTKYGANTQVVVGKIRNEHIRGTLKGDRFGQKIRHSRLRWFDRVKRWDDECVGRKVLDTQLPEKRKQRRPKRLFGCCVGGHAEEDERGKMKCFTNVYLCRIRCGDP